MRDPARGPSVGPWTGAVHSEGQPRTLVVVLGVVAGALYALWVAGFVVSPDALRTHDVSVLQAHGQPYSSWFVLGDLLTGVVVVWLAGELVLLSARASVLTRPAVWLCVSGLVMFGVLTAVSCVTPICVAGVTACVATPGQVFDLHDTTGGVAAFGQFLSLVGTLVLVRRSPAPAFRATAGLLVAWCAVGLLFFWLMVATEPAALGMQRLFLVLSSIALAAVPVALTRGGTGSDAWSRRPGRSRPRWRLRRSAEASSAGTA